ncbi:MAG: NYN domain-containing protein [Candidatus Izemoplasmataceae bacterium]
MNDNTHKIAMMIDGENISSNEIENVFNETSNYGSIIIGNLYFNDKTNQGWKEIVNQYALSPKLHYNVANKKNGSDIALAVDAMNVMHKGNVDTVFIVSSDSDFTALAKELKANGITVYGIGKEKSPDALKNVYSKFITFEVLDAQDKSEQLDDEDISSEEDLKAIKNSIRDIIITNQTNDRLILSELGKLLNNKMPSFDPRKYGAQSLSNLIRLLDGIDLEIDKNVHYAKLTDKHNHSLSDIKKFIRDTLSKSSRKSMNLPQLHDKIREKFPDFDYSEYGYTKFSAFIKSIEYVQTHKHDAILNQ